MTIFNQEESRIRIVVADDNVDVREKVVQLLRPDFDVIGTASDGAAACEAVFLLEPDILVMDISMPAKTGIEAAEDLTRKGTATKIVFLTVHADPDFVQRALKTGVSAYVVKSHMATDLTPAVKAAAAGKRFISPSCSWRTD